MPYQIKETSAVGTCRIKLISLKEINGILENNQNGRVEVPG